MHDSQKLEDVLDTSNTASDVRADSAYRSTKIMGAELVRTTGIVRSRCKIGMTNIIYDMRRFVCLERMRPREPARHALGRVS